MATNQATSTDLSRRSLRPLTPVQLDWASVRLEDAFQQILVTVPTVGTRLDTTVPGDPFPGLVIQVQCAMVLRVLTNPDGILEEASDDYTRRLDAAVSTGSLYLTDQERALLQAWDGAADGAWTIRARPDSSRTATHDPWRGGFPTTTTDIW